MDSTDIIDNNDNIQYAIKLIHQNNKNILNDLLEKLSINDKISLLKASLDFRDIDNKTKDFVNRDILKITEQYNKLKNRIHVTDFLSSTITQNIIAELYNIINVINYDITQKIYDSRVKNNNKI